MTRLPSAQGSRAWRSPRATLLAVRSAGAYGSSWARTTTPRPRIEGRQFGWRADRVDRRTIQSSTPAACCRSEPMLFCASPVHGPHEPCRLPWSSTLGQLAPMYIEHVRLWSCDCSTRDRPVAGHSAQTDPTSTPLHRDLQHYRQPVEQVRRGASLPFSPSFRLTRRWKKSIRAENRGGIIRLISAGRLSHGGR